MQEELTEYEKQKAQKKRGLVRNELQTMGKYQIPLIKKQEIDFGTISLLSYVDTKTNDEKNAYKTVH